MNPVMEGKKQLSLWWYWKGFDDVDFCWWFWYQSCSRL